MAKAKVREPIVSTPPQVATPAPSIPAPRPVLVAAEAPPPYPGVAFPARGSPVPMAQVLPGPRTLVLAEDPRPELLGGTVVVTHAWPAFMQRAGVRTFASAEPPAADSLAGFTRTAHAT